MNYGRQITKNAWFDLFARIKNRIIIRYQYRILERFGNMPFQSRKAMRFSRIARRLVGGYIYSIKLEVNDYCNLKCRMCYVDRKSTDLPDKQIFNILDQLRGEGIRLEILGGEPLMRKNILEIIRYAKEQAKIPFISLYTNGTRATPEMAAALRTAGLDAILVTLVSHRREVHDDFTGIPGSWQQTVNGIRSLARAGIATYSFTTVHSENVDDCKKIYQFVKDKLGAHSLFYQYIPQQKDDPLMIPPAQWHTIKQWILLEENPEHARFVRDFYMISGNACSGGNFVFTVKVDGSVQPCPFIHNMPLGNIYETTIWKIYRHRFNNSELVKFKTTPTECRECAYESICGGGCKAGNDLYFGRYNCKDLRCLGPFSKVRDHQEVMGDIPTFF
ncbi:MAG: radical SAM protein [Bacteroidales bacterium]